MVIDSKSLILVLRDGRVIICQDNGYKIRTLESDFGKSVSDTKQNDFGSVYWEKKALEDNSINREEILMSTWSDKTYFAN